MAMSARPPTAAPIPIPALAPPDRPELELAAPVAVEPDVGLEAPEGTIDGTADVATDRS